MTRKEKLEEAKKLYQTANADQRYVLERLFPELAESEDEQSRKWILEYLYDGLRKSDEQFKGQFKTAIDWLEKQGKNVQPDIPEDGQILNSLTEVDERAFLDRPVTLRVAIDWLEKHLALNNGNPIERTERYCKHFRHVRAQYWCDKGVFPVDCKNCDKADWIEYTVTTTNQITNLKK